MVRTIVLASLSSLVLLSDTAADLSVVVMHPISATCGVVFGLGPCQGLSEQM